MAKAKESTSDTTPSAVFTSEVANKTSFIHSKKNQIIAGIILGLLVIVTGVALTLLGRSNKNQDETPIRADFQQKVEAVKSEGLADPAKANETLDDLDKQAETTQEKAYVKYMYAQVAVNNGDYDKAIDLAREANKVEETASNYGLIGFAAKMKEDWGLAADSFAKAAELSPDSEAGDRSPRSDYKLMEAEMRAKL